MQSRALGKSGVEIAPLVFGGNVFGWTADKQMSFRLLDAFVDAGFDAIDTADVYSRWGQGHTGGESETIIGQWLAARSGTREKVKIFTKVGSDMGEGRKGLSARWIEQAVEDSLRRLQTDYIDVYFSHWPDESVAHEETLRAYAKLIEAGKVRTIGASNYSAEQLRAALDASEANGLPRYEVIQPEYNLVSRSSFEGELEELVVAEGLGAVNYFSLAAGFLTGKYRSKDDLEGRARGRRVAGFLDERGLRVVEALDEVAERRGATPAEVAIAWILTKPAITAPIASATNLEQLQSLVNATRLELGDEDVELLDEVSF